MSLPRTDAPPGSPGDPRIRVLRVISRLIIGGPTVHVQILCKGMDPRRFRQWLVAGHELAGERSMVDELVRGGVEPRLLPEMVGESRFGTTDLRALASLRRIVREVRPHVVHTHTGKAGILGRIAARLARVPVVVHTFHGHVLDGYWGPVKTTAARLVERGLARITDRLVAVSPGIKRDLVRYGVAPEEQIAVVPLGLDLDPFLHATDGRGELRAELDLPAEAPLVGIVGRIVPIKNHRLFLDAARQVLVEHPAARFVVVGDGLLRDESEAHAREIGIGHRVFFVGWRRDLPRIYADLDVVVISSNNEGTPVSAIEAMAAERPVVSTRVGGVPDLITDGETGALVPPRDSQALASAIASLLANREVRVRLGRTARSFVRARYAADRLIADVEDLYVRELARKGAGESVRALPPSVGVPGRAPGGTRS